MEYQILIFGLASFLWLLFYEDASRLLLFYLKKAIILSLNHTIKKIAPLRATKKMEREVIFLKLF